VEVDRVLFRTNPGRMNHADVGQRQEQFVVFIDGDQRRRLVGIHDADLHDGARVDVTVEQRALVVPQLTPKSGHPGHSQGRRGLRCHKK